MEITSPNFKNEGDIPARFTCDGDNINPTLHFNAIPESTVSLALICEDPDAPMGTWTHWTLWNISPQSEEVFENSSPAEATEGITSFGSTGYGGPCPPDGTHRYTFHLYALDTQFQFGPETTVDDLKLAMDGHVIDSALLMGHYTRQR